MRASRAFFRLAFGRSVIPAISTSIMPATAWDRHRRKQRLLLAQERSCLARTRSSIRGARRRASNSSNTSASRSQTAITRVLRVSSRAALSVSSNPSSHRAVVHRAVALVVHLIESQPQHAKRQPAIGHCRRRMQMQAQRPGAGLVTADDLQPFGVRTACKTQVAAVLDRKYRPLPRMRAMLRARCGARMFSTVTSDSEGCSMRR